MTKEIKECAECPFLIKVSYDDYCNLLRTPIYDRVDKYIRYDCPLLKNDITFTYKK